jgi:hypothetical protein
MMVHRRHCEHELEAAIDDVQKHANEEGGHEAERAEGGVRARASKGPNARHRPHLASRGPGCVSGCRQEKAAMAMR